MTLTLSWKLFARSPLPFALLLAACGDNATGPGPEVITPGRLEPGTIEQVNTVGATVTAPPIVTLRDTRNRPLPGAAVTFQVTAGGGTVERSTVTTSTDGSASAGTWVLGTRPGINTLEARAAGVEGVTFAITATVGPATSLEAHTANPAGGIVGQVLEPAPAVVARDAFRNPVANLQVTFSAAGGTLVGSTPLTDTTGVARLGSWRLGNAAGTQSLEARAGALLVSFTANAAAGAPAVLQIASGEDQSAPAGTLLPGRPSVRVRDALGNVVPGILVHFAVADGGGIVSGAATVTGQDGTAAVGGWTLGTAAGLNRLTASVDSIGSVTFNATGIAGPAARLLPAAGDGQSVVAGSSVPVRPTVRVSDAFGNPVAGVPVSFVASPGGQVTGPDQTTAADGTASVGSWMLAASPGTNTLAASASGIGNVTFTATGVPGAPPASPYRIELVFLTALTAGQRAAFEAAAARWQSVIAADLPDYYGTLPADGCGEGSPAISDIDDLVILVRVEAIDGVGSTLASAGPCYIRSGSKLPMLGRMSFDTADLTGLELSGRLEDVILHELGHVLGIGTIWNLAALLQGEGGADPFFIGTGATSRFILAGGSSPPGYGVPVENTGGAGTRDSHWREAVMRTELMTGWVSVAGTPNPLSAITIGSLADLGYAVNLSAADPFTLPGAVGYEFDTPAIHLIEQPLPPPRVAY